MSTNALVIVPASWPSIIPGDAEHNAEAVRQRAAILAAAEAEARSKGLALVHVCSAEGATLDVWSVTPGVVKVAAEFALPNVVAGSWIAFPSKGVPYAPGEDHGWRAARVISRKRTTARVEWWNRRGGRGECTVRLSECKSIQARKAPTPESAAAKLKERARVVRLERIARRGH